MHTPTPSLAVVIPCLNEENYVGLLLDDLQKQSLQPSEVFVVDCHSKDTTVAVAKRWSDTLPLQILQSPYQSAAEARNEGAAYASTDYILFLDADMRISADFVERLMALTQKTHADFISPKYRTEGRHPVDILLTIYLNVWIRVYNMRIKKRPMGIGGAMLVKKSVHDAIGGFTPRIGEFDDVDYSNKLARHNASYAFAGSVIATTSNRRLVQQGRVQTLLQLLPKDAFLVRKVVRPLMKRIGMKQKWSDD